MPTFSYRARTAQGQTIEATLSAINQQAALKELHSRGYFVLDLRQEAERMPAGPEVMAEAPPRAARFTLGLSPRLLGPFFRAFWSMLHAGWDMAEAAHQVSLITKNARLKRIATEMSDHARQGGPVSAVLARYPQLFSPMVEALVRVGERSGDMETAMRRLAEFYESAHEYRVWMLVAALYPALLLMAVAFLAPIPYAVLGGASAYFRVFLMVIAPVIVLLIAAILLRVAHIKGWRIAKTVEATVLALPFVGGTRLREGFARWSRAMTSLWEAGYSVAESYEIAAQVTGNRVLSDTLLEQLPLARRGEPLTAVLATAGRVPQEVLTILEPGERSGTIGESLRRLAETYDMEAQGRRKIELIVFFVALLVLVLAIGAYFVITFYTSTYFKILGQGMSE